MAEYRDTETAVYEGASIREKEERTDDGRGHHWEATGHVTTRHAIVQVYSYWYRNPNTCKTYKSTRMYLVADGRLYDRFYHEAYRPRYLVTLAKRFAAEKATNTAGAGG